MGKIWRQWRWTILLGAGIIAFGFTLRFIKLTLLPVFVDEAIYIRWAQIMANEPTLRFLPLSDGKQPLYMWLLMFFVNKFSDPLFIGRLVSVAAGIGTIVGIFVLSQVLFKNKLISLIGAFMWAISPFALFFDRLALVDSLLTMLGLWVVTFAIITAKTMRLDFAMITGFLMGLSMLTKSSGLFFLILLPVVLLFAKQKFKLIFLFIPVIVIAFGMYNILRLGPNFHLLSQRTQDYVYPYSHILTDPLNPLKGHLGGIINYFYLLGPVSLVLLFILGIFSNLKKYWKEIVALLVFVIGPIVITAEYSKVVTARYILFTVPYFVILGSLAFIDKSRYLRILGVLGGVLFMIQSAMFDYKLLTNIEAAPIPHGDRNGYLEEWTAGQGIKEIAEFIKKEHTVRPDKKIVIGTEGYFGTLPQGLEMYLQGVDNVIVIGVGLGIDRIPQSLEESRKAGNMTYLVVNKSRLLIKDPKALGLELIATYPKALRRVGSREYSINGPREELFFFEIK